MPEMDVASTTETIIFFVFATITILGALGPHLCTACCPFDALSDFLFHGSFWNFHSMGAEFLAPIQILVYLASVGLVVLFGIMLTRRQIQEEDLNETDVYVNSTWLNLLAGAMITVLGTAELWDQEPDNEVTTLDLANTMLDDWALPLLILGVLMAMAMMVHLSRSG